MSPDPPFHGGYPFVIIMDEKYYYGKDPIFGQYMVAHEFDGKRYWNFEDDEQAMIDFLENLPESAKFPTIGGAPLWLIHGMMPQEAYDQVFSEHEKYLRFLLDVRRRNDLTFDYRYRK